MLGLMCVFVYNPLFRQQMSVQVFFIAKRKPIHCLQERVLLRVILLMPMTQLYLHPQLGQQTNCCLIAKIFPMSTTLCSILPNQCIWWCLLQMVSMSRFGTCIWKEKSWIMQIASGIQSLWLILKSQTMRILSESFVPYQ